MMKAHQYELGLVLEDTIDAIILLFEKADRNRIYNISSEFEQSNLVTAKDYKLIVHGHPKSRYSRF